MERTGKCLCGEVSYVAKGVAEKVGVCHCGMCRRWAGGPFVAVHADEVAWKGDALITTFKSSAWAERGFCQKCGAGLFYRVTAPGPHEGSMNLMFGTLDDQEGLTIQRELFIDRKPACYALMGDQPTLTEAEVMAEFGG